MKITKVDVLRAYPNENSWHPVLIRVHTDEGIYGDGEVALGYGNASKAAFSMVEEMAGKIIGMNPLQHEVIWQKLYREACFWGINGGPIVFGGISAIDIALWDIKGKVYQSPLHELLGGKQRSTLRAYASQLQNGQGVGRRNACTPEDYAREALLAVEQGFDAIKIDYLMYREDGTRYPDTEQTGLLDPERMELLETRIAATRQAVGPKVDIILENHCYTDAQGAVQMGNMAKKYRIFYYEEPTTPHADLLSYVHRETGLPVASGERIYTRWQYNKCLQQEAIQVIQPDLGTCGGITEVKKICDLAYIYESTVQIHCCGTPIVTSASLQFEGAIPNFTIHEHNVNCMLPNLVNLAVRNEEPVNGKFIVSDLPGIGNEISEEAYRCSHVVTVQ